jgi:hypothetical protein
LLAAGGEVEAATGAALEEGLPVGEGLLEGAEVLADDGAGDAEVLGGGFEAAGLDGGREGFEPDEVSRELARGHRAHPDISGGASARSIAASPVVRLT